MTSTSWAINKVLVSKYTPTNNIRSRSTKNLLPLVTMMTPEFKAEFVIVIDMSEVPCVCVLNFEIIPQKVRV